MKYVFILGVTAAVLIFLGAYFLFGADIDSAREMNSVQDSTLSTEDVLVSEENQQVQGSGTFLDLQNLGKSLECQVRYDMQEEGELEGTLFVSDGKLRTDFVLESPEYGQYASSVILDDEFLYSWSAIEGSLYGVKIAVAELEGSAAEAQSTGPVAMDENISYTCTPWVAVDASVFTPPSTVRFQDMSNIQNAAMEYGTIYEEGELPY